MALRLDLRSSHLPDSTNLENLPLGLLFIIISHLNTARDVAHLAMACKKLHRVVEAGGWRIFVRAIFGSLALPSASTGDEWMQTARRLTFQSRAWDRRAFSLVSCVAPRRRGRWRGQTFPPQIIVDATSEYQGGTEEETVAWGAGENVVIRRRKLRKSSHVKESWTSIEGSLMGFSSGSDDVTSIAILHNNAPDASLLVGRASGYLQLLSTKHEDIGRVIAWFQPSASNAAASLEQREIQHFDTEGTQSTIAAATKGNVLFYSLNETVSGQDAGISSRAVNPVEALDIRKLEGSPQFKVLREVKFLKTGDLALGMTSSYAPLRYLTRTPTGTIVTNAAKQQRSRRSVDFYAEGNGSSQTVRSILPLTTESLAGSSGRAVLSSYDDGTIRLQDLRSPSAFDTIYQDHFELTTPVGPLLSYGMERFIAGSARDSVLKIFDYRWTKSYSYTDTLPCGPTPLGPTPRPLISISPPQYPETSTCAHRSGQPCRLHFLARTSFYRPNCNIYLPVINQRSSPVYSLAKSSDISPVIYAGLSGELVEFTLGDEEETRKDISLTQRMRMKGRCGYSFQASLAGIVETGDGIALRDMNKSNRVPIFYRQKHPLSANKIEQFHRLDELLVQ